MKCVFSESLLQQKLYLPVQKFVQAEMPALHTSFHFQNHFCEIQFTDCHTGFRWEIFLLGDPNHNILGVSMSHFQAGQPNSSLCDNNVTEDIQIDEKTLRAMNFTELQNSVFDFLLCIHTFPLCFHHCCSLK